VRSLQTMREVEADLEVQPDRQRIAFDADGMHKPKA